MPKRSRDVQEENPSKSNKRQESSEPSEDPYYRSDEESVTPYPEPSQPKYHKSFRVGNVLKILGPRKKVLPAKKITFTLPKPPPKPRKPTWLEKIRKWSKEEGIQSTYEIGESSQAPTQPISPPETETAFEVMIARMERLNLQTYTVNDEMNTIEGNARYMSDQIDRIRRDCEHNRTAHRAMRDEMDTMAIDSEDQKERILNLESIVQEDMRSRMSMMMVDNESHGERISNLEYGMQTNDQLRALTENRVRVIGERVGEVDQQLGELMEILIHFFEE